MSLVSPLCLPERLILKYPSKQAERNLFVVLPALSISVRICLCYLYGGKAVVDLEDWLSRQNLLLELLEFGSGDLCGRVLWGQI